MKKQYIFFIALIVLIKFNSKAQLSSGGVPHSFEQNLKNAISIPSSVVEAVNARLMNQLDSASGITNRIGVVRKVNVDLKYSGVRRDINNVGTIYQYAIETSDAKALSVHFSSFHLPDDASVFVYSEDKTIVKGAFTSANNKAYEKLSVSPIDGKKIVIEYFEPANAQFPGDVVIGYVSVYYKSVSEVLLNTENINCPEWKDYQLIKHAVCRILFDDAGGSYLCSGALVNNTRNDGTPYFLTAHHCISSDFSANSIIVYFNYEYASCSSTQITNEHTLSGSMLCNTSSNSDYTLLKLSEVPPSSYYPYFAGWDASNAGHWSGTAIHHPSGRPKSIALANVAPAVYSQVLNWDDGSFSQSGSHWVIAFSQGFTEQGSSGSPFFDESKRIIGQLHGGDGKTNFYGRFSVSYNSSGLNNLKMSDWLDPDNTGKTVLDGYTGLMPPTASFLAYPLVACLNAPVKFSDLSLFNPISWQWTMTPNTYNFLNGTNSTSQNPEVEFLQKGYYTISLKVTSENGINNLALNNYILATDSIRVLFTDYPADKSVCGYNLEGASFKASGAEKYEFYSNQPDKLTVTSAGNTATIGLITGNGTKSTFGSKFFVIGHHGSCTASDSIDLKVKIPYNDNAANALQLKRGENGPFSNECATTEAYEPHPSTYGCEYEKSWCKDINNSQVVVNNTLWFTFTGPANGYITIDALGFDDRICVYKADSLGSLFSNNPSDYEIIAANDNRAGGTSAFLKNIKVEPYKKYWLQLDGYKKAEGECYLTLYSNNIEIYPNPSKGNISLLISHPFNSNGLIEVFSPLGQKVLSQTVEVSENDNIFSLNLTFLPTDVYTIVVTMNDEKYRAKALIYK